jgi:hypothetical protein
MRVTVISSICAAFLNVGAATAMPLNMTVDRLFSVCEAPTVGAAAGEGDELGWQRLTDAETEEWRTSFVGYNGGSVELVGWRREQGGAAESLSFWIAVGPNGHKACTYSTARPAGLLDALSERLGPPDTVDKNDAIESISAWWTRDEIAFSFVQVGSSALVSIGPNE